MHDIADLENRGLPGVFVASTEFAEAAALQSRALGFPAAAVFVAHPIQDRTDDEMGALADAACDELVAALTGTGERPEGSGLGRRPAETSRRPALPPQ